LWCETDDDIDRWTQAADVVPDAVDVGRIDGEAVARTDLGHTRLGLRGDLLAVLVPPSGVLQKADSDAHAFGDGRSVRFGNVSSTARVRDAVSVEDAQRFENVGAIVGDVVGDTDRRDVPGFQRQHALGSGMAPSSFVRNVDFRPLRFDEHPFEICVDHVGTLERLADARESGRGIGAALDVDVTDDRRAGCRRQDACRRHCL
jgi:hypothetical protein